MHWFFHVNGEHAKNSFFFLLKQSRFLHVSGRCTRLRRTSLFAFKFKMKHLTAAPGTRILENEFSFHRLWNTVGKSTNCLLFDKMPTSALIKDKNAFLFSLIKYRWPHKLSGTKLYLTSIDHLGLHVKRSLALIYPFSPHLSLFLSLSAPAVNVCSGWVKPSRQENIIADFCARLNPRRPPIQFSQTLFLSFFGVLLENRSCVYQHWTFTSYQTGLLKPHWKCDLYLKVNYVFEDSERNTMTFLNWWN